MQFININRFKNSVEIKNFSWLVSGKVIQMIISLVIGLLVARYLGPSNFGLINYSLSYTSFFTPLCTLGITSILVKNFTDKPDEIGQTIGTTLTLRTGSALASLLLIIVIVLIVDRNEPITILITFLVATSLLFQVFDTFNYWFQYKYKAKVIAIVSLVAYVLLVIYRIILLINGCNVQWFAFSYTLDYLAIAILLVYAYKRYKGPKLKYSYNKAKELLFSSYHFILSGLMVAIYGYTDKLMLKHMLSEKEVGFYSVATAICTIWVFVLNAVIDALYPTIMRMYREDKEAYRKKNIQLYAIVFYVSTFVSLIITVFATFAIGLLYGAEYLPAAAPLQIITWYTAFSYLGVARNAWIVCEHKQKYLKYMYVCAAIINVLLNLVFIPLWGTNGAALASLITQLFTSIIIPLFIPDMRENAIMMLNAIFLKGVR